MSEAATDVQGASPRRKLGLLMCTALVVGNMIGSGVFLLPASLARFGGISIVGWLVSAAGAICLALVFARLGHVLPRTGGPYAYARAGFGDFGGFLVAWAYWISMWTTNAALSVAFVSYMTVFVPSFNDVPVLGGSAALAAIWLLTAVNVIGVRPAGFVTLVTTVLKLLPLVAITIIGLFFFDGTHFRPFNASGGGAFPAISATVTLTLWAFLGLESGTVPAGEVVDPERTIPRATIVGTLIATTVYILGTVAVMGLIEPAQLVSSTAPFADAARLILGPWGAYLVAAGAAISCFGALNGWILLSGQLPLAAARDGVLPAPLARLGPRGTPVFGIVLSSVISSALVALNYTRGLVDAFTFMILLATLATLIPYVFSSMAVLLVRPAGQRDARAVTGAGIWVVATLAFLYA
ncbi:MAG TPA: amino acid permease, partial [Longimicrobiales bacterium]|nr:amino acid permease [Longimicrobiales bacterium]